MSKPLRKSDDSYPAGTIADKSLIQNADGGRFEQVRRDVVGCVKCPLCETRNKAVFGSGERSAKLMFIGEAPGAQEDLEGEPFVGRAGQLLTKSLAGHHIARSQVFITNIVKCRPPDNRDPLPLEIATCTPYLYEQIELIQPDMICALGRYAAATLLGRPVKITLEHGQWLTYRDIPFMIALHPSAALRSPKFREQFDYDIKLLAERFHQSD